MDTSSGAPQPRGLDAESAAAAQRLHGRNDIGAADQRGFFTTLGRILVEPMFLLLLVAAGLYLAMGDPAEGVLLGLFALMTVGLVLIQERRSERVLDALRRMAAPQARAWRSGALVRLPAADLVPGDVVLLDEGDRVPADGIVREGSALAVDEALLSGESVPVRKTPQPEGAAPPEAGPGGDDRPSVFAGTLVVRGHGVMEVTAIGRHTQIGRIGSSLATIDTAPAPLELQSRRLVRVFSLGAAACSLALAAWYGLVSHDWMRGLLAGIALAMAMLPEELPMALSIFLALGAWRLARAKVLVRRPTAIDSLGATTLLCLDKTGTLTRNELRVARLATPAGPVVAAPDERHRPLLDAARAASRSDTADPLDRAVFAIDRSAAPHAVRAARLVREYPLAVGHPMLAQAWDDGILPDGRPGIRIAVKGAPEAIAALSACEPAPAAALRQTAAEMAAQGLRVIAVAETTCTTAPARLDEQRFVHLGLIGFADPLREDVPAAIARARRAGVDVAMITGDHVATALAIAAEAGIDTAGGALTGGEIAALDAPALAAAVATTRVFARVAPAEKLRLVQAFQAHGGIVAMTGDGVNDAPALKAAHVGIAMGARGTDVAREAAQVVLLDEQVGRIVDGIALGRRIFENLRKVTVYIVAVHVPIAGAALLPLLFGLPPLLLPVHVVLTEMVIDPMCSLVFENAPAEPALMSRMPRTAGSSLVDAAMLARGLTQGGVLLAIVLAVHALALLNGMDAAQARALGILALVGGNVALVAVDAGAGLGPGGMLRREFAIFWIVAVAVALVAAAGIGLPAGRALLQFGRPPAVAIALALAVVAAAAAAMASVARRSGR